MLKNTAFYFLSIILIVYLFSFLFSQQSFAQTRLYQCSPAFDYATSTANCGSGPPVECFNPFKIGDPCGVDFAPDGNTCASWSAICHGITEGTTLTGSCIDKCTDLPLTKICSPDVSNTCPDPNFTCEGNVGNPISGAGDKTFCIQYTVVAPTPTPISAIL